MLTTHTRAELDAILRAMDQEALELQRVAIREANAIARASQIRIDRELGRLPADG